MAMNTSIQTAAENKVAAKVVGGKPKTIQQYVIAMEGEIKKALPSVITPERFTRITMSAISSNPKLAECTPSSFLGAMMTAAQLGLEPNTPLGHAWLVPFRNHGVLECQFQLGYRGMIDLAYRSGSVGGIQAHIVYDKDEFDFELGAEPYLKHKPASGDRGNPIYVYARYKNLDNGEAEFGVMSIDDVRKYAKKYSKSYDSASSPWTTNFEAMAKKTVLKQTLKYAPMKSEFFRAMAADGAVKTELAADMLDTPSVFVESDDYTVEDTETNENANTMNEYTADEKAKRDAFADALREVK